MNLLERAGVAMKVSVVVPVYNDEGRIAAAVESALAQRFDGSFEVIVVNDGSTDGTRAVLAKFGDRITVIDQQRRGVSSARNAGIKAAAGEYIALLDSDDTWTEDKLAKTVLVLDNNASCVAVFSDATVVEIPGRFLLPNYVEARFAHSPTLDEMLNPKSWPILPSTCVIRRETLLGIGGFPEEFAASDYGCEDTFAFLLMRERGEMVFLPDKLVRYRMPEWETKLVKRIGALNFNGDGKSGGRLEEPSRYFRGNRVFARLMRVRYGARGRKLSGAILDGAANELAMLGMMAMHAGDHKYARRCYRASIRHRPFWLKTYIRLGWTMLPAIVSQRLAPILSPPLLRSLSGPPFTEERSQ
jgi:glycosyltransferase involved in cell wall biosynthesis